MAGRYFQPLFRAETSLFWSEKRKARGSIAVAMLTSDARFATQNMALSGEYGGCE